MAMTVDTRVRNRDARLCLDSGPIPTDAGFAQGDETAVIHGVGFGASATHETKLKRVQELVPLIQGLAGVEQVQADTDALAIRVEYS
jgi:hypothetical protein